MNSGEAANETVLRCTSSLSYNWCRVPMLSCNNETSVQIWVIIWLLGIRSRFTLFYLGLNFRRLTLSTSTSRFRCSICALNDAISPLWETYPRDLMKTVWETGDIHFHRKIIHTKIFIAWNTLYIIKYLYARIRSAVINK